MKKRSLKHPPKGCVWIHIDKFGKKNGKVWAIQDRTRTGRSRYRCANEIVFDIKGNTKLNLTQPRAVLRMYNTTVEIIYGVAYVTTRREK